jgi:hypothetical protein
MSIGITRDEYDEEIEAYESRIALLEAVAEAAFNHCNISYGSEEFFTSRAILQQALRKGYLKEQEK